VSGLASGHLRASFGLTEPEAGSDSQSMRTRAEKVEGGWRLNGRKHWISGAHVADVVMVMALTDPAKKADNLQLIVKIKASLEECKKLEPSWTKKVPAADKPAFLAKFKEQMDDVAKSYATIETAIKADKFDDAKAVFEKLADQKEKGHKDFHADDDK
jgi:hypothetical protein